MLSMTPQQSGCPATDGDEGIAEIALRTQGLWLRSVKSTKTTASFLGDQRTTMLTGQRSTPWSSISMTEPINSCEDLPPVAHTKV